MSKVKNSKRASTRKEWQQRKHFVSRTLGLIEKIGDNCRSKALTQLSEKLEKAKEHSICQDKGLFQNIPKDSKAMERIKETMREKDCNMLSKCIEEIREIREDGHVKEVREGKKKSV